jgi:hypothetical protein
MLKRHAKNTICIGLDMNFFLSKAIRGTKTSRVEVVEYNVERHQEIQWGCCGH